MRRHDSSDAYYLLAYFAALISAGTALLALPPSWAGTPEYPGPLATLDALFTATSAVCVTGLVTADTSGFTHFGQTVILLLIQFGGLGIISFTSMLLALPGRRLPLRRLATIRSFYVEGVEFEAATIVRNIVFFTLIIEAAGAAALFAFFEAEGVPRPAFSALFHAVSAFCNAGFSLFPTSLESFSRNPPVLLVVAALVVLGGVGFIVLQDLERRVRGKRRRLSYHTKVVLGGTATLIVVGTLVFLFMERHGAYADLSPGDSLVNALFQAVMPRTAGFDAVPQAELSLPSRLATTILMFIGGAPGSIAGGVKVTTIFVVFAVMTRRQDERGDIHLLGRRLSAKTQNAATVYFLKAVALLLASVFALALSEGRAGARFDEIVFEATSAFGTVGLSLGLTPRLSGLGKLVIIATMFAGRVGLIALAFPAARRGGSISRPEGTVLLG